MTDPACLDIVVPMAGYGARFAKAAFKLPKPLIDVEGQPMIRRVIDNLRPAFPHRFLFLVLREHLCEYDLEAKLKLWAGAQTVCVPVTSVTEGAACTVLLAQKYFGVENDLMIANSDQLVDASVGEYLQWSRRQGVDGSILVFEDDDEKWSFAKVDAKGVVTEVAEKRRISNLATVGIYYFRRGQDFATAAQSMIAENIRVNGEFYVCPVYNQMIGRHQKILTWKISKRAMHGVGTPEDLKNYLGRSR